MEDSCLNCGTTLNGKYCHNCGQKVLEVHERTLQYFFKQFFGYAFFLENKFVKNLWYTLVFPGIIPLEILNGRRKRYMQPLSLFLMINLFYFMFNPMTDMNLPLIDQINQPFSFISKPLVEHRIEDRGITFDAYALNYDAKSSVLSKSLVIIHVPIFALFVWILYRRKNYFFVDHLVYSLYFIGAVIMSSIVMVALVYLLHLINIQSGQFIIRHIGWLLLFYILYYLISSALRYYRQTLWITMPKVFSMVLFFLLAHFIYRFVLFFIVYLAT
jgi:hypothetical protein